MYICVDIMTYMYKHANKEFNSTRRDSKQETYMYIIICKFVNILLYLKNIWKVKLGKQFVCIGRW